MFKDLFISAFVVLALSAICFLSHGFEMELNDGVYEGEHSFVKVEVNVRQGKVENIKMLEHGGGGERYADMISSLPEKMLAEQTSSVDAVSGATVSSRNLKRAVEDALNKASK